MNDEDGYCIDVLNEEGQEEQEESSILDLKEVPGVLHVDKTFGRKGKRLLYRVIPFDKNLPSLLIPYDLKVEFSKEKINKYVLFEYIDLEVKPIMGKLLFTIGNENDVDSYHQYLLHGREVKMNNSVMRKAFKSVEKQQIQDIFDACIFDDSHIFTIDGAGSEYYDDAISISKSENGNNYVSLYIANVAYLIEKLELWNHFGNVVKTVYLSGGRELMLPKDLTELCSLKKGENRLALKILFEISQESGEIIDVQIQNRIICVAMNYIYDESKLTNCENYNKLVEITRKLDDSSDDLMNSRDVVAYWMILVNKTLAKKMACCSTYGIYKKHYAYKNDENLVENLRNGNNSDYYVVNSDVGYAQFTCPLRRMADVLNIVIVSKYCCGDAYEMGMQFVVEWLRRIDLWNKMMKRIRRIENNSYLFDIVRKQENQIYHVTHLHGNFVRIDELNRIVFVRNIENVGKQCKLVVLKMCIYGIWEIR